MSGMSNVEVVDVILLASISEYGADLVADIK